MCCTLPSGSNFSLVLKKSGSRGDVVRVVAPCGELSHVLFVMVSSEILKSPGGDDMLLRDEVDRGIEIKGK